MAIVLLSSAMLYGCAAQTQKCPPSGQQVQPAAPSVRYEPAQWSQLDGWTVDSLDQSWSAFLASCTARKLHVDWSAVCELARQQTIQSSRDAQRFFEAQLAPYRVVYDDGVGKTSDSGLITGYYEPILRGSRSANGVYKVPLFAPPDDLLTIDLGDLYPALKGQRVRGRLQGKKVVPYFDRAQLETSDSTRGKELVWVDDPIDAFFLQIQGSGRIQLEGQAMIRLAYADQNGHPYRAIGRYLVDKGELTLDEASAQGIQRWLRAHPERLKEVLSSNPSVVFFREEPLINPQEGPKGSLGVALTAGRSIAVDPRFIPLGTPVFLATTYPDSTAPLQKLTLAQDTGGAIRGGVRADFFWGSGPAAGESAGKMRQEGRLWVLWPKGKRPAQGA
jgi:membrane-bound lytic murein transglycosylase A